MEWFQAAKIVSDHVFRISTPRGTGSGFLILNSATTGLIAVATASHVVDSAHYWEEPIRLEHASSGTSVLLRKSDRAIILDQDRDSAAIILQPGELKLPEATLQLGPKGKHLKMGVQIAWLGFPAILHADLCFFEGRISSWLQHQKAYLVDGVAINGVSGGPAFKIEDNKQVLLAGLVTAYAPNRATGETLPGLSVIHGVSEFHKTAEIFKNLEQAQSEQTKPSQTEISNIDESPNT